MVKEEHKGWKKAIIKVSCLSVSIDRDFSGGNCRIILQWDTIV